MSQATDPTSVSSLVRSLRGTECPACGERKKPRHSFCGNCYLLLPVPMRAALYRGLGNGYAEAFAEAAALLADLRKAEVRS